jgi:cell division protein FtsB
LTSASGGKIAEQLTALQIRLTQLEERNKTLEEQNTSLKAQVKEIAK